MHLDQRDFWQHSQSRVAISEQASDRADSRGAGLMLIRLTNLSDSLDYQHTSNTHFPKVCGSVYPAMDYLHIANQVSGEWSEVTLHRTSFWYHAWKSINFGWMPFFCSPTWANLPLNAGLDGLDGAHSSGIAIINSTFLIRAVLARCQMVFDQSDLMSWQQPAASETSDLFEAPKRDAYKYKNNANSMYAYW